MTTNNLSNESMTRNNNHDNKVCDPKDSTIVFTLELTHLDKKEYPEFQNRVHAVLKLSDKTTTKPFMAAKFYDKDTGEFYEGFYYKSADEAVEMLRILQHECLCPLKTMTQLDNCACDFLGCAWYYKESDKYGEAVNGDAGGCAYIAQAEHAKETRDAIKMITDKINDINITLNY